MKKLSAGHKNDIAFDPPRKQDWAAFACAYNGKAYKENNYDSKMALAYARAKAGTPAAPASQ